MKPRLLLFAGSIAIVSCGCFYSSRPVDSSIGSNCKAQTAGLMFLSRPEVTCEKPAQPPAADAAAGPPSEPAQ